MSGHEPVKGLGGTEDGISFRHIIYEDLEHSKFRLRIIEQRSKEAEMKSSFIALTFTALSVICLPATSTFADDSKVAKGTITAISGASLTVKVGDQDMAFNVDTSTMVTARGASSKSARLAATGKPGPHLSDVLQPGQAVAVTYSNMAGSFRASAIKAIPKASANTNPAPDLRSTGVVKATGADWITINGTTGGGASFEQTFKLDPHTLVWAKGASRAVAAKGGKAPFTELIGHGDRVIVAYHKSENGLLASDLHVTMKAAAH
jgi:hypothetical protein